MWKDFKEEKKSQVNGSTLEDKFNGRVVEVHSGDCLSVERESDLAVIRLYFASVKAPVLAKPVPQGGQ